VSPAPAASFLSAAPFLARLACGILLGPLICSILVAGLGHHILLGHLACDYRASCNYHVTATGAFSARGYFASMVAWLDVTATAHAINTLPHFDLNVLEIAGVAITEVTSSVSLE